MQITEIQIFKYEDELCSANIIIDDLFMIQLGNDGKFSIPLPNDSFWIDEDIQEQACAEFNVDEIVETLNIPAGSELEAMPMAHVI